MALLVGFTTQCFLITSSVLFILFNYTQCDRGLIASKQLHVKAVSSDNLRPEKPPQVPSNSPGAIVGPKLSHSPPDSPKFTNSLGIVNPAVVNDATDLDTAAGKKVRIIFMSIQFN